LDSVINVDIWQDEQQVGVEVSDQGPGFSDEDLAKLFTAYQRLSAQPTGGEDSHGLGLAIAWKIADLHGGSLEATNLQDGPGACFRFAVPRGCQQSTSRSVLLAEDNKVLRFLIVSQLEKLNHRVHAVDNGVEAVEAWSQHTFDLILMDLQMPGMDGLEALRIIRSRESGPLRTPIIALTSATDASRHQEAFDAGADATELKPITGERLQVVIDTWVTDP